MKRIVAIVLGLMVAVLVLHLGLLMWFDGERIRSIVSQRMTDRYGVAVRIERLERSLWLRPLLRIENLQVANAERSDHVLIEIDKASVRIHPWSFLIGPATLDDIFIDGIRISVPVDDEGALYWDPLVEAMSQWLHRFDWSLHEFSVRNLHTQSRHVQRGNDLLASAERIDGSMPRLADLTIDARGVDANLETTLPLRLKGTAQLDYLTLQRQEGDMPVTLSVSGHVGNKVLKVEAAGGNLLDGDPLDRDPLRAIVEYGAARANVQGTMSRDDPMHLDLAVVFNKAAKNDRPALHVEMDISDPGTSWRLGDIRASQGESNMEGAVEIANQRGRRYFGGSVTVSNLDYPEPETEETAEEKGLREVLPDGDLYSHLLQFTETFDADFIISAKQSRLFGIPFEKVSLRTLLDQGKLVTTIEDSKIRDTSLNGSLRVTPGAGETKLNLEAALRDAQVSALVGGVEALAGVTGRFDGDIRLEAAGNETQTMLKSANGRITLFLDNGAMPDELATRIAGDVMTAVFADFEDDDKTTIRCAVVDFSVENGLAEAQRMLMDTGVFRMHGSGRIELPKGLLDIELVPRAKDFSLISMRLPLRIHGPFDDIKLNPDVSEGVASLLTPIEFGDREEADCSPPGMVAAGEPSGSE